MSKMELLATFFGPGVEVDPRHRSRFRDVVYRVRFRRAPREQIECSCGVVLPYASAEHDVGQLAVLHKICMHIEALYRGHVERATLTELAREMFTWRWAQLALERSR